MWVPFGRGPFVVVIANGPYFGRKTTASGVRLWSRSPDVLGSVAAAAAAAVRGRNASK